MRPLKPVHRQIAFFAILVLALFPLAFFPLFSVFYHDMVGLPQVSGGVLDLQHYDLSRGTGIPLDGQWEFYQGKWIVDAPASDGQPDLLAPVPMPWHLYPELDLAVTGIGSYRITLQNCPEQQALVAFIPNINGHYRAYLNGVLVAARGDMSLNGSPPHSIPVLNLFNQAHTGAMASPDGTAELVIELASPHVGGMYQTPVLMEAEAFHARYDVRSMASASIISVTFVSIACVACLLFLGDKLFASYGLLLLDALAFFRILFQSNYLDSLKRSSTTIDYVANISLQAVTLLLPVAFLLCMRQMLQFNISNRKLVSIACFDGIMIPLILWMSLLGKPYITFLLYLVGCVPYFSVFAGLYGRVKHGVPYALEISGTLLAVFASMIGASMLRIGILTFDVALFPPVCFLCAMLFQLWIFLRRSIEAQRQAVEAENLRLRLKQSKSDLMMSQIKPHFLYNSLIAIHTLCTEAPETAAEATLKFATFLRTNMNMVSLQGLVPFEKELAHIQNYADIELMRHQKRLTVRYEIGATEFQVPPLSIQPLVENAIRHGACKNIAGGVVTVKTYETDRHFAVEITDDGPGFDPNTAREPTAEPHGLQNILFRLEHQGADVKIESQPDHGTRVLVLLPREGTV